MLPPLAIAVVFMISIVVAVTVGCVIWEKRQMEIDEENKKTVIIENITYTFPEKAGVDFSHKHSSPAQENHKYPAERFAKEDQYVYGAKKQETPWEKAKKPNPTCGCALKAGMMPHHK
jgi:hypothetical protein